MQQEATEKSRDDDTQEARNVRPGEACQLMRQVTDATDPSYWRRFPRRWSAMRTWPVLPSGSRVIFTVSRARLPPSPALCCWDWPLLVPVNAVRAVRL